MKVGSKAYLRSKTMAPRLRKLIYRKKKEKWK